MLVHVSKAIINMPTSWAVERERAAREAEAPFKAAQEEVGAALAEVKAQEDARNAKTAELEKKSND